MKNINKQHSMNDEIGEKYFELLRKNDFWEKYIYNAKEKAIENDIKLRMNALNKNINILIPSKNDIRYNHIRNFRNHNLSNNLALDMLIRNKKFADSVYAFVTLDENFELNSEEKEQKKRILERDINEKFGLNPKDIFTLTSNHPYINQNKNCDLDNLSNQSIELNPPYIFDIKNGINKVVDFYFEKKQLYIATNPEFIKVENPDIEIIEQSPKEFFVFSNYLYPFIEPDPLYIAYKIYKETPELFPRIDNNYYKLGKTKFILLDNIDKNSILSNERICIPIENNGKKIFSSIIRGMIPLEFLDKEFRDSIQSIDLNENIYENSSYKEILPILKFSNSKFININLNLDLSIDELTEYIKNLKEKSSKFKSFSEIFNQDILNIDNPKNIKSISTKEELRNRDYANAFYIYDLYNIIGKEFLKKEAELNEEVKIEKEKIEKNQHINKQAKEHEYNKLEERLKKHLELFSKTSLDYEIKKITGIEISKIRGLYSLLKEYIEEDKFKNLILGKFNTIKNK